MNRLIGFIASLFACALLLCPPVGAVEQAAPPEWRWHGHRVVTVDGSTCTMPDTPENQAEYP